MLIPNKKTVCFTGHRPQTIPFLLDETNEKSLLLKNQIIKIIMQLIEKENAEHFISGMAIGVDQLCAEIVLDLKKQYPHITLECAFPCKTQAVKWSEKHRERYFNIIKKADKRTMVQKEYTADCMMKRNKYMVDNADIVIAVWNGERSGTGNTVFYAKSKGKVIVQVNPENL